MAAENNKVTLSLRSQREIEDAAIFVAELQRQNIVFDARTQTEGGCLTIHLGGF